MDFRVCDDYDDDLIKECHELQAENDRLKKDSNKALIIHAKKFFDDNPKAKEVYCFLVDASGVSDDGKPYFIFLIQLAFQDT